MRVIVPSYTQNYGLLPFKTEEEINQFGFTYNQQKVDTLNDYVIAWGNKPYTPQYGFRYGVMETGFFYNASFIDTVGNYQSLSLNTYLGYKAVADFNLAGRKSAKNLIFSAPANKQSKYNPVYNESGIDEWEGPILILQNPMDRSILSVTSREGYLQFIKDACKFYGKNLFVKFHPWNSNEIYRELESIVKPYGCQYGKARMEIILKSEFCIGYNSTFAIDALLRDVPYVQYAMGTFFSAYGIIYSEGEFPTSIKAITDAYKLPDFLIHKYCFNKTMNKDKMAAMFKHYANSTKMFPMIDEFSYANNI